MKISFILFLTCLLLTSCFDEDPSSKLNINFDNNNYVLDASTDVTFSSGNNFEIFAQIDSGKLKIEVANYSGEGTYVNDAINFEVTFEGVEYTKSAIFKTVVVHNDTDVLLSGVYDFRQPDNITNDAYVVVGAFNIEK